MIELTKYFFTLFEKSGKPVLLKVDIQFMKDFINVIEVLKSEDVNFSKVNIQELQFVTSPLSQDHGLINFEKHVASLMKILQSKTINFDFKPL